VVVIEEEFVYCVTILKGLQVSVVFKRLLATETWRSTKYHEGVKQPLVVLDDLRFFVAIHSKPNLKQVGVIPSR
jgi:hypothetical protein